MKTVIVSISAKNIHKGLAAWCLKSYCQSRGMDGVEIVEANINSSVLDIIEKVLQHNPQALAFSCYIWNIDFVIKMGGIIKKMMPNLPIILGGPEVSFEEDLRNFPFASHIIRGAGESAFYDLLCALERDVLQADKIIGGGNCGFNGLATPLNSQFFESFQNNAIDIANSLVYYESSRGCPFSCTYCLSSAEQGVEYLDLGRVENELLMLVEAGAKTIKFVDRTFNAKWQRAAHILRFIGGLDTDCTFHFEVAADLFNQELLQIIEGLPCARVQFEIGIQSVNEKVLQACSRKTDLELALKNIAILVGFNNCHIHLDLIAGLPHETLKTFKEGVNTCITLKPHMLQLGFLKMLKGTKMRESAQDFGAIYTDYAPYEILKTSTLSFDDMRELKLIEAAIDRFYNSCAFINSIEYGATLFSCYYDFFKALALFCPNLKLKPKNAFETMYYFLSQYGDRAIAEHTVKLDSLSQDSKSLPDCIEPRRLRVANKGEKGFVRAEYFELDGKTRIFDYSKRNPITNRALTREAD